jgi:hypothetical protein
MKITSLQIFEFYLNLIETEQGHMSIFLRRYHFGWIQDLGHWIKRGLGGSDCLVPFRLSDLIWAVRSRSNGRSDRGEKLTMGVRVLTRCSQRVDVGGAPVTFRAGGGVERAQVITASSNA